MWIQNNFENQKHNFFESKPILKEDKNAVKTLLGKLLATKIKHSRAEKYYIYFRLIIERGWTYTYHDMSEERLYSCLSEIEHNPDLGAEAKRDYKICLKRILEHLENPLSKAIKTTSSPKYLPRFFLTVHNILKMVTCDHPHLRDKAMAACLYESNCRPHEFFMLKRSDIRFDNIPAKLNDGNGGSIDIHLDIAYLNISQDCKTGARSPPLIFSVPWLKAWLKSSSGAIDNCTAGTPGTNPDVFLWTELRGSRKGEHIQYAAARKAVRQLTETAGIKNNDKVTLYSFRHGRNTEVSQCMTYAEHCEYAGWYQGSDMPRTYNHLAGLSMVSPLLSPYGIQIENSQNDRNAWIEIMKHGQNIWPENNTKYNTVKNKLIKHRGIKC